MPTHAALGSPSEVLQHTITRRVGVANDCRVRLADALSWPLRPNTREHVHNCPLRGVPLVRVTPQDVLRDVAGDGPYRILVRAQLEREESEAAQAEKPEEN